LFWFTKAFPKDIKAQTRQIESGDTSIALRKAKTAALYCSFPQRAFPKYRYAYPYLGSRLIAFSKDRIASSYSFCEKK
jgi:hypothetical protein